LFDPKIITRSEKIGDKTKYIEYLKINDFYGVISDFLAQFNDSHYSDDRLGYSSSFTDLVVKLMNESDQYDFFTIRVNDYPDDRVVTENINSHFLDYL
jgi:predicted methyltransferase